METSTYKAGFSLRLQDAISTCPDTEKMSQKEIGKFFGVSPATISYWLDPSNRRMPSMDKVIHMAVKLCVCVEWLYTGRGHKRPKQCTPHERITEATQGMSDKEISLAVDLINTVRARDRHYKRVD